MNAELEDTNTLMEAAAQRAEEQRDALREEVVRLGAAAGQAEGLQADILALTSDLEKLEVRNLEH